ncbi:hypothetical protein M758_5G035200 [Ceratodon purpureus]|nr:hypothetical protein M758_5G035200 [Ceratodon purpureus]
MQRLLYFSLLFTVVFLFPTNQLTRRPERCKLSLLASSFGSRRHCSAVSTLAVCVVYVCVAVQVQSAE